MTRYIIGIVFSLCVVLGFGSRAIAQQKFAVVDLQRAINETEDGRKAKDRLKQLFKQRQQSLDKKQESLTELKDTLEKQRNVLSKDALQKKMEDYQKAFGELQNAYMEYQKELQQKEQELTKTIIARMERIIRRIGQAENYTLIMERNEAGVVWVPVNLDVTDAVIQRYNAGEGADETSGMTKPAPAPTPGKNPPKK